MEKRFTDKVVLITGGSGEIGQATAKLFLEEGAKVAIVGTSDEKLAKAKENLGDVLTIKADVRNEDDVKNYVNKTVEKYGKIDVFFNNAGIEGKMAMIEDIQVEDFKKLLDINVTGMMLGMKYVIPVMRKQKWGSIINTSSVAGLGGTPGLSPYVASKHAVIGLTKSAALEVANDKIRVNTINPAPIEGRMMKSIETGFSPDNAEAMEAEFIKAIPLGRYGKVEEVAKLVLFLASDDASYITGSTHRIDGGSLA
ncbi:MAG: SDR family NAD(P)-dependent oxidoreductase [Gudongella sp.]|nr:SDR family NAD(P)-dependent oxidoreductase [Gudongella sp.]